MKKKIIALTLSVCLVSQLVVNNQVVNASENSTVITESDIEQAQQRVLDSEEYNVSQKDSDGDGLIDYWEEIMETDPYNMDTDDDGLTDYEEVFKVGTDPCLADTDGNGILDIDEDADGDGLTNLEEVSLGTDPNNADTDNDMLTDGQEVYMYGTNPLKADSNGDGVADYEPYDFGISLCSDDEDEVAKMLNDDNMISMLPEGSEDFNNDGISDEYTKMMCEGTILTSNGEYVFGSLSYEEVQNYTDLDEDALANGAEISLHEYNGEKVVKINSNPMMLDTDNDGINDADDTAPLTRGLKGGVIGKLKHVARHNDEANFLDGHAFLVFTSYVDDVEFSIDELYARYNYVGSTAMSDYNSSNEIQLTYENEVNAVSEENLAIRDAAAAAMWQYQDHAGVDTTYSLNRGEFVALGNYPSVGREKAAIDALVKSPEIGGLMDAMVIKAMYDKITGKDVNIVYILTHFAQVVAIVAANTVTNNKDYITGVTEGGVYYNREFYNQKHHNLQYPNAVYEIDITQEQFDRMVACLNNNSFYSLVTHNCSSVSSAAWNAAVGYDYDNLVDGNYAKTQYWMTSRGTGIYSGFDVPMSLKNQIRNMADNPADGAKAYVNGIKVIRGNDLTDTVASEHENLGFVEEIEKDIEEDVIIDIEINEDEVPVLYITDDNGKIEVQITDTVTVDDIKKKLEDASEYEGNEGLKNQDLDKVANTLADVLKFLGKFSK